MSAPSAARPGRRAIRVLIAHQYRTFADALHIALARSPGLRVAGVAHDPQQLVEAVGAQTPDIVLLDEDLPGAGGLGAAWDVKEIASQARVLVLTSGDDELLVARAAEAGADAILPRSRPMSELVSTVQALGRGEAMIDPEVVRRATLRMRHRREESAALGERLERLTRREIEILQAMADGLPPEEIAETLCISPHTLRTHVQNVLTKLRVHSKLHAVTAAIRHGRVRVRHDAVVDVERRIVDLTAIESRDGAYAGGTTGSTSSGRSGRGRSRGS